MRSDGAPLTCSALPPGTFSAVETDSPAEAIRGMQSAFLADRGHRVGSPPTLAPAPGSVPRPSTSPGPAVAAAPLIDGAAPAEPSAAQAGTQLEIKPVPESDVAPVPAAGETSAPEHGPEPEVVEPALLPGAQALVLPPTPAAPSGVPVAPRTIDPASTAPAVPTEKDAPLPGVSEAASPASGVTSPPLTADASPPMLAPGPAAQPVTAGAEPAALDGVGALQQPPASAQPAAVHNAADPRPPAPMPLGPGFAERLGLTLARKVAEGRDEITVRMEPAELGRVQVRLSFDEAGSLRALVSADSPLVLDSLRREAGDLARALADNGVRTDAQSFRFDRGAGGHGSGEQHGRPAPAWTRWPGREEGSAAPDAAALPQPLRHRGRLNLMA